METNICSACKSLDTTDTQIRLCGCQCHDAEGTLPVEFTRYGFRYDYTGAHVTWNSEGHTYLAEVVEACQDDGNGILFFRTRHFNGEPAPDAVASTVRVLDRTWTPERATA